MYMRALDSLTIYMFVVSRASFLSLNFFIEVLALIFAARNSTVNWILRFGELKSIKSYVYAAVKQSHKTESDFL